MQPKSNENNNKCVLCGGAESATALWRSASSGTGNRRRSLVLKLGLAQAGWVIWSSEQAHSVDALAAEGDEGRGSLR